MTKLFGKAQVDDPIRGSSPTQGDVIFSNPACVGAGSNAVVVSVNFNGAPGILKILDFGDDEEAAFDAGMRLRDLRESNPQATGGQYFVSPFLKGQMTSHAGAVVPVQLWEKADGVNLDVLVDQGGFGNADDDKVLVMALLEGLIFLKSAMAKHGDVQLANIVWNARHPGAQPGAILKFVDYANMRFGDFADEDTDISDLHEMLGKWAKFDGPFRDAFAAIVTELGQIAEEMEDDEEEEDEGDSLDTAAQCSRLQAIYQTYFPDAPAIVPVTAPSMLAPRTASRASSSGALDVPGMLAPRTAPRAGSSGALDVPAMLAAAAAANLPSRTGRGGRAAADAAFVPPSLPARRKT